MPGAYFCLSLLLLGAVAACASGSLAPSDKRK